MCQRRIHLMARWIRRRRLDDADYAEPVLLRLADWTVEATRPLSDAQFETMLNTEHGGMNEVFADAYQITGNKKYMDAAKRFSHLQLFFQFAVTVLRYKHNGVLRNGRKHTVLTFWSCCAVWGIALLVIVCGGYSANGVFE